MVVNPLTVGKLCFPLQLHAGWWDFRLYDSSDLKTYLLIRWYGPDALADVRPTGVYLFDLFCSSTQFYVPLNHYLCFIFFLYLEFYVLGDDY